MSIAIFGFISRDATINGSDQEKIKKIGEKAIILAYAWLMEWAYTK